MAPHTGEKIILLDNGTYESVENLGRFEIANSSISTTDPTPHQKTQ